MLVLRPTVTLTATARAEPYDGVNIVQLLLDEHATPVAEPPRNRNNVADGPGANPLPCTVTSVPPALAPVFGLILVIVGFP